MTAIPAAAAASEALPLACSACCSDAAAGSGEALAGFLELLAGLLPDGGEPGDSAPVEDWAAQGLVAWEESAHKQAPAQTAPGLRRTEPFAEDDRNRNPDGLAVVAGFMTAVWPEADAARLPVPAPAALSLAEPDPEFVAAAAPAGSRRTTRLPLRPDPDPAIGTASAPVGVAAAALLVGIGSAACSASPTIEPLPALKGAAAEADNIAAPSATTPPEPQAAAAPSGREGPSAGLQLPDVRPEQSEAVSDEPLVFAARLQGRPGGDDPGAAAGAAAAPSGHEGLSAGLQLPDVRLEQSEAVSGAPVVFAARLQGRPGGDDPGAAARAAAADAASDPAPQRPLAASLGAPAPQKDFDLGPAQAMRRATVPDSDSASLAGEQRAPAADSPPRPEEVEAGRRQQIFPAPSSEIAKTAGERVRSSQRVGAPPEPVQTAQPLHHQPEATRADSASDQATRSAAAERLPESRELPDTQPAPREISLRLSGGKASGSVSLQFREQSGQVQVLVRSSDNRLSESLRERLPMLAARLERVGFQAEIWRPVQAGETLAQRLEPVKPGQTESRPSFQHHSQEGGRSDSERQPRHQQPPADWGRTPESGEENPSWGSIWSIQHDVLS